MLWDVLSFVPMMELLVQQQEGKKLSLLLVGIVGDGTHGVIMVGWRVKQGTQQYHTANNLSRSILFVPSCLQQSL